METLAYACGFAVFRWLRGRHGDVVVEPQRWTMLAGAAELLSARRDQLSGEVLFMFQPGEEGHHGARFMLDDGLIDPLPDAVDFGDRLLPLLREGATRRDAGRTT